MTEPARLSDAEIDELLNNVEEQDRYWLTRPFGEYERQVAALIRQLRAERDEAQDRLRDDAIAFLEREGYYRCNAAACNCGLWHGGRASERLESLQAQLSKERNRVWQEAAKTSLC